MSLPAHPLYSLAVARSPHDQSGTDQRVPHPNSSRVHSSAQTSRSRHHPGIPDIVQNVTNPGSPELVEENRRVPHVQLEGRKAWEQFDGFYAEALEHDLYKFKETLQELGSSADLARSGRELRENLCLAAWLFRENARKLFPLAINPVRPPEVDDEYGSRIRRPRSWPPPAAPRPDTVQKVETTIYVELRRLATSVEKFIDALEQFPEFDTSGSWHLRCFEGDLKYWSSCLQRYQGQFESREVQTYIHDLSRELGARLSETSRWIKEYIDAVPTVRISQKHTMSNLQNLAAVATFFSAVTATTIQYSFAKNDTLVSQAVNVFWFSSLVFSIASALNSFLVVTWRRAAYSPQLRIPWWLHIWIHHCPPIFLLVSVVTFLVGLGCFSVSSEQAHFTWIVVLICEGISSFGLAALLVWLAADKWSFYRLQRQQQVPTFRLTQIFGEKPSSLLPTYIEHTASWSRAYLSRAANALSPLTSCLKFPVPDPRVKDKPIILRPDSEPIQHPDPQSIAPSTLHAQQQWKNASRTILVVLAAIRMQKERELLEYRRVAEERQFCLRRLSNTPLSEQHEAGAAISGMHSDPRGSSLVICGKRLSMRHELGSKQKRIDCLRHQIGQALQVTWSHSGDHILTRTNRAIHIWKLPALDHQMIVRYETSSFILGVPNFEGNTPQKFLSIEGRNKNKLALINVLGEEVKIHEFDGISIQHVDFISDGSRVLLAATNSQTSDGIKPVTVLPARKLMVYNLKNGQVEHDVPLWHNVQHVAVSKNGKLAIVTYKSFPPPQLWGLQSTPTGIQLFLEQEFCARERVSALDFDPTRHIQFTGKAQFLDNDRFIVCTTTEGRLHFWRRDKADPVYVLSGTEDRNRTVQIECNRASHDFMFATRSQDGTVRIWNVQNCPPMIVPPDLAAAPDMSNLVDEDISLQGHALTESPQSELPERGTVAGGDIV